MESLVSKKSVGHDQVKALTQEEIKDLLAQVPSWEFIESNKITKEFKFEDFVKAMEFVNKVAKLAEEEGHHPDIEIHYNKVNIILWTHFVNGLSENDFIVAAKIDQI